jgi:hypothetical protein
MKRGVMPQIFSAMNESMEEKVTLCIAVKKLLPQNGAQP